MTVGDISGQHSAQMRLTEDPIQALAASRSDGPFQAIRAAVAAEESRLHRR
jgi:hypothetical protein